MRWGLTEFIRLPKFLNELALNLQTRTELGKKKLAIIIHEYLESGLDTLNIFEIHEDKQK